MNKENTTIEKSQLALMAELLKKAGLNKAAQEIVESCDIDWKDTLETSKGGKVLATYNNFVTSWENAECFKNDTLKMNEFTRRIDWNGITLNNCTWARMRNMFEQETTMRNKDIFKDFVLDYSARHMYNPVKDYLESLVWDGKKRIETMFIDWFNAEDTEIIRKMTEKWMVSGVKRIYSPGCGIEGMIILQGAQGIGKSTFCKRLGKNWGIEAAFDIKDEKKCAEVCNEGWIINFDELKSFIKNDPETAKVFLTRTSDSCRLAYREEAESYDRHCIFIGSTNDISILKDYSGNIERRYWIIKCDQQDKTYIHDKFTDDIVDQLWAEAYSIYKNNPNYNITISDFNDAQSIMLKNLQKEFKTYSEDDLVDAIKEILNADYQLNSDGTFNSPADFRDQILNKSDYFANTNIKRIPFSYINFILTNIYHTKRPNKWIAAALEDDWEDISKANYGNNRLHCLVRHGCKNLCD